MLSLHRSLQIHFCVFAKLADEICFLMHLGTFPFQPPCAEIMNTCSLVSGSKMLHRFTIENGSIALKCTGDSVLCFGRQDFTKREFWGLESLYLQSMGYLCFSASLNAYISITRAHGQSHIILRLVLDPSNGCQRLVAYHTA